MSFFQRIIAYVANELLVERLANSRTFQAFAITTDKALKDLKTKAAEAVGEAESAARGAFDEAERKAAQEMQAQTRGRAAAAASKPPPLKEERETQGGGARQPGSPQPLPPEGAKVTIADMKRHLEARRVNTAAFLEAAEVRAAYQELLKREQKQ
mmetsp:Transcript_14832/g.48586  ORF Transcript_14832/g.48586 Transcript_14832/m.48586 type:complete len:155 (+) Transcript_14832:74-538(+)